MLKSNFWLGVIFTCNVMSYNVWHIVCYLRLFERPSVSAYLEVLPQVPNMWMVRYTSLYTCILCLLNPAQKPIKYNTAITYFRNLTNVYLLKIWVLRQKILIAVSLKIYATTLKPLEQTYSLLVSFDYEWNKYCTSMQNKRMSAAIAHQMDTFETHRA